MQIQTQLILKRKLYQKLEMIDIELKTLTNDYYKTIAMLLPTEKPTKRELKAINSNEELISLDVLKKRLKYVHSQS
jgi:hypothetical protein